MYKPVFQRLTTWYGSSSSDIFLRKIAEAILESPDVSVYNTVIVLQNSLEPVVLIVLTAAQKAWAGLSHIR
jgi:hypothetical protein